MMRSKRAQPNPEPFDRRRMRLMQTMLAFPVAGIVGFAGSTIVRSVFSDDTAVASPATPGRTTDETPAPHQPEEPPPRPEEDSDAGGIA